MANKAERFFVYCNKLLCLDQQLKKVKDLRVGVKYHTAHILAKVMAGIVTGVRSFNQMEKVIKEGTYDKIGGRGRPSGDTLSHCLKTVSVESLEEINDRLITKIRRNKSLKQTKVEGYRVCAVDGTGIFSTYSERLGKSLHFRRGVHGEEIKEPIYLEHAIAVSYVGGSGPKPILALQRIPAGQGETTIALQVVKELYQKHFRYCDIITVDALHAKAPFINEVLAQNKDIVVRVKQQNYDIIKDADALFGLRAPDHICKRIRLSKKCVYYDLEIWDDDSFTSWEAVKQPLRCLRIKVLRRKELETGEVLKEEEYTTHLVTSCPKETIPALTVWKIAHARWDIENSGFHFLKHHFQLEHAYGYDPNVVKAMLRLFALVFNLFQLFVRRNIRGFDRRKDTLLEIMRQIHDGLVEIRKNRFVPDLLFVSPG